MSLSGDIFRSHPEAAGDNNPDTEEALISMSIDPKWLGADQSPHGGMLENIEKKTLGERVQGHKTFSLEFGASQAA